LSSGNVRVVKTDHLSFHIFVKEQRASLKSNIYARDSNYAKKNQHRHIKFLFPAVTRQMTNNFRFSYTLIENVFFLV
jgi:hypothetical protein